jgi:hypothetical protein
MARKQLAKPSNRHGTVDRAQVAATPKKSLRDPPSEIEQAVAEAVRSEVTVPPSVNQTNSAGRVFNDTAKPSNSLPPPIPASRMQAFSPPKLCDRIVIGRRDQRRLEINLVLGDITQIDASAYVLGLFSEVTPGGAALSVDAIMGGLIMQMNERRMLSANIGQVSFVPKGRHPLRADILSFVGLGAFDSFKEETLETACDNLIRLLILGRIDDFAMVLFGGGSGIELDRALYHVMAGFTRGLVDADDDHPFRRVTICEIHEERFDAFSQQLYRLCGTRLFDNIEVTLRERRLPVARQLPLAEKIGHPQPLYLMVRQDGTDYDETVLLHACLLTQGAKATTFATQKEIASKDLERHLERLPPYKESIDVAGLSAFGEALGELLFAHELRTVLSQNCGAHLIVVHDTAASRIPWETLHIGGHALGLSGGLSHRYEARNLSVAKWLHKRQMSSTLSILLIIDPTEDLPNAAQEGVRITQMVRTMGPALRITAITGARARRKEVLNALSSGEYDVVHYAGHAFFDAASPERSGLLCAGSEVLSGSDLASVSVLPSLMFFNACEAARIRREAGLADGQPQTGETVRNAVGFAEALLRGGVTNYLGTYWPVQDKAAGIFATEFYLALLSGERLGEAILKGRTELKDAGFADWANYMLYGDPNFVLKPCAASSQ